MQFGVMIQVRNQIERMLASEDTANAVDAVLRWREVRGRSPYAHPDDESAAEDLACVEMELPFRAFMHTVAPRTSGFQRFIEVQTGDALLDYLADLDLAGEYGKVRTIGTGHSALVLTAKAGRTGTLAVLVDPDAWGDEELQDWDFMATAMHLRVGEDDSYLVNDGQDFLSVVTEAMTAEQLVWMINADETLPFTAALATGSDGSGAVQSWKRVVIGAVPKEDARVEIAGKTYVQKQASRELLETWDVQEGNSGLLKTLLLAPSK